LNLFVKHGIYINLRHQCSFMIKLFNTILLILVISAVHAQNFEYRKHNPDNFLNDKPSIDSTANAEVIQEFGTGRIQQDDNTGALYLDYTYHVKIKIFNKEGFSQGNVVVPLNVYNNIADQIRDIQATTYNHDSGIIIKSELDLKQVFTENKTRYQRLVKFTMPNLKPGSVIEYAYKIRRQSIFNFSDWEFQSDIPKVHSEFVALIPGNYNFNVSLKGMQKLTSQNGVVEKECLRIAGTPIDCSKMTYIMKNIPAFQEEAYMTAASNFKSAINFELSDVQYLRGGKTNITKNWKDVDYELTTDAKFGGQMKRKDLFIAKMPEILKNASDSLSKAKAVFDYIKAQIKWNNYGGKYAEKDVKKALETHSGNIGDINLGLISALAAAGFDAEAVILSTRQNGIVNNLYPVISEFDYVVGKVKISGVDYLLDASEPLLPFGLLPLRCMNGKGRVIAFKKPSYWYDLKASQKESAKYNLIATLGTDGKIKGNLYIYSNGYTAYYKRQQIEEAGSEENFVQRFDDRIPNLSINKHEITNIDSLDNALVEKYDVELNYYDGSDYNKLFFNPNFLNQINTNPFNLNERNYPVDMGAASEIRVSMMITLPKNFELGDISMGLPENGGRYQTFTKAEDNTLSFSSLFQLNKPVYAPEEYLSLKEFYSKIIQQQKIDLVLQKSK
jgi:transglutaminase-like putative cysteine protease